MDFTGLASALRRFIQNGRHHTMAGSWSISPCGISGDCRILYSGSLFAGVADGELRISGPVEESDARHFLREVFEFMPELRISAEGIMESGAVSA